MKVSENTNIQLPLRNLISIIGAVALGVWAYFGVIERLNTIETNGKLMIADVEKNTEFRIKWPRGEMGSLPADSEQFLLKSFSTSLILSSFLCCKIFLVFRSICSYLIFYNF